MSILMKEDNEDETSTEFVAKGVSESNNGIIFYKGISNSYLDIKANDLKNSYIMTEDYEFYFISKIYKHYSILKCEAYKMNVYNTLKVKMNQKTRIIPHIFHTKKEYRLISFNVDKIKEKVIFLSEFIEKSPVIDDNSKGFIVRTIYKYHN